MKKIAFPASMILTIPKNITRVVADIPIWCSTEIAAELATSTRQIKKW
jgi:hypothetical protein